MMLVCARKLFVKSASGGGQNLTAVEGNASAYQVHPVSRITGEGRAELFRA